jgi:hypothetical protein
MLGTQLGPENGPNMKGELTRTLLCLFSESAKDQSKDAFN